MDATLLTTLAVGAAGAATSVVKHVTSEVFSLADGLVADSKEATSDEQDKTNTGSIDGLFSGSGFLNEPLKLPYSASNIEDALDDLQQRVDDLLEENGFDLDGEYRFTTDSSGHVRIKGDVENKEAIEQLINSDFDLSNEFRLISSSISIMKAAERQQPFLELYETDPEAAVAQYGHLFNDSNQSIVDIILNDFDGPSFEEALV